MSLLLVFVTADGDVIKTVAERRGALIPADLRKDRFAALDGEEVVVSAFKVERGSSLSDLLGHLDGLDLDRASGVVLLSDDALPNLVTELGDIFCVNRFSPPAYNQHAGNVMSALVAKALRAFRHYKMRFDDRKYQTVLRVPLRNFAAAEVGELRAACRDMISRENFGTELNGVLARLRGRQRPKKVSHSREPYLVDDDGKHFRLGHEQHAQADTAKPPHNDLCILANVFRFGRAFDGRRHFNVSRDANAAMVGDFLDCHDALRPGGGGKHLNMFSNDFF